MNKKDKLGTLLSMIFFWCLIIFPFFFILSSFFIYPKPRDIEKILIKIICILTIWSFCLGVLSIVLTILNNWQINRKAHSKFIYNRYGVYRKERILKKYFEKKYGKGLQEVKKYTISTNNNIPLNEFMKIYKKEGIDKKDGN